jgi:DNA-directed RNA polymerase specialized sigma subunit
MANDDSELDETVREEAEFLRDKLREQLGREPTDEEVNEWLREHTESY